MLLWHAHLSSCLNVGVCIQKGWTSLSVAASRNLNYLCHRLLAGISSYQLDGCLQNGFTALLNASVSGFAECVVVLVEGGAKPDLADKVGGAWADKVGWSMGRQGGWSMGR